MASISEIGSRIKILREQKGITQRELGEILGCPQTTVASWERQGKVVPRKELITPIAEVLGVSESYLLGLEKENSLRIKHLGILKQGLIHKTSQKYLDVTDKEYKNNRFSIKISENEFEPCIMRNDYCIFEESRAKENDIVLAKLNGIYTLKRWKKSDDIIILIDISLGQKTPVLLKKQGEEYKGRLVTLKRYLN